MRDYFGKKYNCDWEPDMLFKYENFKWANNKISDLNHSHEHN